MLATRRSIRMLVPLGAALVVSTVLAAPATGAPSDYVRMSDGTPIAINVNRALDRSSSDRLMDGTIYRPHRPHTNPTLIEPAKTYKYLVEVFPVGHVFRPGHRLVLKLHTPPAVDSYYVYVPKRVPAINTLHHDAEHPSRLMAPFVPLRGTRLGPAPQACSLQGIRCVPAT